MRGFSERPKSVGPSSKTTFDMLNKSKTTDAMATTSMRRANTNESLVNLEIEALSTTPPDHTDWAHKQLMGMVNRSADGQRVTGDDPQEAIHSKTSAFSKHGRPGGSPAITPELLATSPLVHSQPVNGSAKQQRSLLSSSSTSSLMGTNTLRRGTGSSVLEARMKLKREKDLQMARHIMEEENKKAKDKERLREAEERLKAKVIEEKEQEELKLRAYYEQHEKQHSQSANSPGDDNFAYFRTMKKKIKDINVKPNLPNLPSIGLDEKLKKFNTRVKGFLSTTNPTGFSLPIKKFGDKNKNGKHGPRNLPIKLNVVDDFMKDLELQRLAEESSIDSRDGLSPIIELHSNASSSPSDVQKKARARRRMTEIKLANKSASELQLLIRSLNQELHNNNQSIAAAQQTCAKIRAEMESTKTLLTRDVDATGSKVSRANTTGTQFASTVKEIRNQLDTTRTATSSCSDQIKRLEIHVQKVRRSKKSSDTVMRYAILAVIGVGMLYLVAHYRTCQVLAAISAIIMFTRIVKDQHSGVNGSKTPWFTIVQDNPFQEPFEQMTSPRSEHQEDEEEGEDDTQTKSTVAYSPTQTQPTSNPTKPDESLSSSSGMRRNHSDLVLQSLLNEEEFADVFNTSPKLSILKEEDESMGISPGRSRRATTNTNTNINYMINNNNNNANINPITTTTTAIIPEPIEQPRKSSIRLPIRNNSPTETKNRTNTGPPGLRTSATRDKDSMAMNLAIHNLNQMSLKIQQMQQGK